MTSESNSCWCGGNLGPSSHPLYRLCVACGCHALARRYTSKELKAFYGLDRYWRDHVVRTSGHPPIEERSRLDMARRVPYWYSLIAILGGRPRSLLEIGCAHGGFLSWCRQQGITDIVGIEVDEATCSFARETFDLPHVVAGLFPEVHLPRGQFDLIAGFDVLEHFPGQVAALEAVARLLSNEGRFIFQTPCWRGEDASWEQFRPKEHLFLHCEQSIRLLCERAGLRVDFIAPGLFPHDIYVVGTKSGVIRNDNKVAVVRSDAVGDAILFGSALSYITKNFQDDLVTVICQDHLREFYVGRTDIDDVLTYSHKTIREFESYRIFVAKALMTQRYRMVINTDYSRGEISDFLAINTRAPSRIALREHPARLCKRTHTETDAHYTHLIDSPGECKPEPDRHKDLLSGLGIQVVDLPALVRPTWNDSAYAASFFEQNDLEAANTIYLACGAGTKHRWYEHYGRALSNLCDEYNLTVVVLGSAGDTDLALSNVQALRTPWINLCGATTLLQAAALISRGRMVVGAETGLVHMAAALGVPNAALVGGGHPGRFMPIAACTTIACLPLTCYQCDWRCSYEQCHCITDFHPYVLEVAIKHVLQHPKETGHVFVQTSRGFLEQTGGPTWAPLAMDCFDPLPRSVMEITPPGPSNPIAAALFGEGARMARQGERTKALHFLKQALTFEPSSWDIQRAISLCW